MPAKIDKVSDKRKKVMAINDAIEELCDEAFKEIHTDNTPGRIITVPYHLYRLLAEANLLIVKAQGLYVDSELPEADLNILSQYQEVVWAD